jgi:hypothetical protein
MSAILVLTPLVVASWPAVAAAVMGAAASMGFSVAGPSGDRSKRRSTKRTVETEIENSEVMAEALHRGEKIVIQKDDVTIEFGQDERGVCSVCVTGQRQSDKHLKQIGQEVAGRVVQQFAYHKLVTELKHRNYSIVDEKVLQDQSIQVRVRL